MNFYDNQKAIREYIEKELPKVLVEKNLQNFDAYIDDFVDIDKYTKKRQLFYDFGEYTFEELTNASKKSTIDFSVFLTFKNESPSNLRYLMLQYAQAFYEMFEKSGSCFNGIVDYGVIERVSFYNAAEANINLKICELKMTLYKEVMEE